MAAPTANPYASSFFAAGALAGPTPPPAEALLEQRLSAPAATGMAERRQMALPPLPPLRTGSSKSASPGERTGGRGERRGVAACAGVWQAGAPVRLLLDWLTSPTPPPLCPADPPAEEAGGQLLGGTALHRLQ